MTSKTTADQVTFTVSREQAREIENALRAMQTQAGQLVTDSQDALILAEHYGRTDQAERERVAIEIMTEALDIWRTLHATVRGALADQAEGNRS